MNVEAFFLRIILRKYRKLYYRCCQTGVSLIGDNNHL